VVKQLLKITRKKVFLVKLLNHDDQGIGSLLDGYTSVSELRNMCNWYVESNGRNLGVSMRNRLAFLLCHFNLLRGESARALEFADSFFLTIEDEGFSKCEALITIMMHGKTNHVARREIGACLRNKCVEICPIGAMALYFFCGFSKGNYKGAIRLRDSLTRLRDSLTRLRWTSYLLLGATSRRDIGQEY
jgi:hypothetical protein